MKDKVQKFIDRFTKEDLEKFSDLDNLTIADEAAKELSKPCKWTNDLEYWDTECGHKWVFIDGGPSENDATYCPFCGREIETLPESGGGE